MEIIDDGRLREELHKHVQDQKDLSTGANCVTEKVAKGSRFRMFLDLDFATESVSRFLESGKDLTHELKSIAKTIRTLMNKSTDSEPEMVLATRLAYKMHVHFPDVIVTEVEAKEACKALQEAMFSHDLYDAKAIDTSVYRTGLRMLWCHKSGMGNAEKQVAERKTQERLFGKGSWSGIYEITDVDTWEKKQERTVKDLEQTSIRVSQDMPLTPLNFAFTSVASSSTDVAEELSLVVVDNNKSLKRTRTDEGKLGFLNDLLQTSAAWVHEEGVPGSGYKVVPQCRMCLVDPKREHSSVGHSCLFINKKSVIKKCFSCGQQAVAAATAKRIINQFNVIILQTPASEDNTYQELRNELLDLCAEQKLKRDANGVVYKRVTGLTYAYVRYKTAKDYLNEIFKDDDRFSDNPNNIDKLEKYMRDYDASKFPFLETNPNTLGFSDGVLMIDTCDFIAAKDVADEIVVRKHFPQPFSDKATPLFDSIMEYQEFPWDVVDMLKSSIGRLFFKVGEKDNWQYMPYLLGEAGTGKSTIMNIVKRMFTNLGAVGKIEDKYLLGGLYDKDLVLIDDVPRNIKNAFDQQTWQSCISGGPVQIRLMNQVAFTIESWLVPMLWGGNWNVDYDDKGQVSRRMLIWNFEKLVRHGRGNATLEEDIIREELPSIMVQCLRAYHEKVSSHRKELVYDWCPLYFKRTQEELREERNPLYRFLKEQGEYKEGAKILVEDVRTRFARHLGKSVSKNLDRGTFAQVDARWEFGRAQVCKSCKNLAGRGCCESYKSTERKMEAVVLNYGWNGVSYA